MHILTSHIIPKFYIQIKVQVQTNKHVYTYQRYLNTLCLALEGGDDTPSLAGVEEWSWAGPHHES